MDVLDASQIALRGVDVRVLERCTSTNSLLLESAVRRPALLACEAQTAGRGRRGRRWHSVPGRSITFSLACAVRRAPRELAALSLVAGVACVRALRRLGAAGVSLKWPNDLLAGGAKLGGILVETRSQAGATHAVIGVGLNFAPSRALARRVRRRIAYVADHVKAGRNEVIRALGGEILDALAAFEAHGLPALREEWEAMDAHAGQRLRVRLADGRVVSGVAAGLAADGALRLRTRAGLRAVTSGRVVSSRAA
ncbi:MAG TPA: biotin--[acetyl-CoA-carboxylase] ligase [Burkholderiales bacterium]|nr:biotin--[acetyl-CoA-carboxylase] ligase [Burkholderiales bacterium]